MEAVAAHTTISAPAVAKKSVTPKTSFLGKFNGLKKSANASAKAASVRATPSKLSVRAVAAEAEQASETSIEDLVLNVQNWRVLS